MSVTIRKKEEPRNTPLLNFLLIASVPVLLAFLGGISTGKSSGINIREYQKRLEETENELKKAQDDLKLIVGLTDSLDALKKIFSEEVNALEMELPQVIADGGGISASQWEGKRDATNMRSVTNIELLEDMGEKINPDYLPIVQKSIGLFKDYRTGMMLKLTNLYNEQKKLLNQGAMDELRQLQEETAKATEKANMESQLRDKDDEIKDLKRDLKDCQRSSGSGDNAAAKVKIEANVQAIRDEVIPLIPTNILSRKGDQARELLRGKLDALSEATQSIK